MAKQRIIVVGGGFAGVTAVRELSSKLGDQAEITLIDKHSYQTSMTQLHEVAAGRVPFTTVQYDFQRILGRRKNVSIVTDQVVEVDKENKIVRATKGNYEFDYLVVSIGSEPNDFGVPGVKEYGYTLWSIEDAIKLKHHLEEIVLKASTELDPEKRKALLTINVAGSGFTGIEMVGELIDWRRVVARDWKLDESEIRLNVVEMMPTIMNVLDRTQADKGLEYLKKQNVNILVNHAITGAFDDHITVNVGGRDEEKVAKEIKSDTLIWTTGVQGNTQAMKYELHESERGHRLVANDYMQAEGYEGQGIYVAGDISAHMEDNGRPQPQIVQAAEQTGHVAAHNIISDITGAEKEKFVGKYAGTLVSISSRWGVAIMGKNLRLTGFPAMIAKNVVYLVYLLSIRSAYYLFQYAKTEFYHTADGRNAMHGHASRLGNVMWLIPLRIIFGIALILTGKAFGIVLGIAIILGFFGFIASLLSIVFTLVAGLSLWYIPIAIALLVGAGRAFGLDFWIQPALQKALSKSWYGKIKSIYHDK